MVPAFIPASQTHSVNHKSDLGHNLVVDVHFWRSKESRRSKAGKDEAGALRFSTDLPPNMYLPNPYLTVTCIIQQLSIHGIVQYNAMKL